MATSMRIVSCLLTACSLAACGLEANPSPATTNTTSGNTAPAATDSTGATSTSNSTPPPPAAGMLDVKVAGTLFTPHAGQNVYVALVDNNNTTLATQMTTVAADGTWLVTFAAGAAPSTAYSVKYFADLNKDGLCNAPPVDHSWVATVPASTTAPTVNVTHNGNFVPVCEAFGNSTLNVTGKNFTPHVGDNLYMAVIDTKDNTLVGQVQTVVVPSSGMVSISYPGLLVTGHAYNVIYFVDLNKNNKCDPTPTDHQWVTEVPAVSGTVNLAVDHNTPQVTICQNFPAGTTF